MRVRCRVAFACQRPCVAALPPATMAALSLTSHLLQPWLLTSHEDAECVLRLCTRRHDQQRIISPSAIAAQNVPTCITRPCSQLVCGRSWHRLLSQFSSFSWRRASCSSYSTSSFGTSYGIQGAANTFAPWTECDHVPQSTGIPLHLTSFWQISLQIGRASNRIINH